MYNNKEIEKKWQNIWSFKTQDHDSREKFYILEMFPYPSGKMHMGHVRNYTLGDVIARFKRMQGYNVLHPMGWDAFGLPAENAAKQNGVNPAEWTDKNIDEMRAEIKRCGFSYDWEREIKTCDPAYFKHEQEFFIKFLEAGLIYQKDSLVNWDPIDNTVLANEQVINGRGWRSGAIVEKKSMKQWFCKITAFAEDLLQDLEKLGGWPDSIKTMQYNWIGRSEGVIIKFKVANSNDYIEVYTTRPDTVFGCTFIGIAYDHNIVENIEQTAELKAFIQECATDCVSEAIIETKVKHGFKTGLYVEHPFDKNITIPVYIANFILSSYGTGAIFGCPAHDLRDNEFAIKYNLNIVKVIESTEHCYIGNGNMINSRFLNGMNSVDAKHEVIKRLELKNSGYKKTNYRLRDWGISRQKYWGCPIPIIHCKNCGIIAVQIEALPITLPVEVDFLQQGNPLVSHPTWKYVTCHQCGGNAERETDTLDTFFESSWYFAKFCTTNINTPIDRTQTDFWMPVDCYIGGSEHAVMHLLYARFFTKALKKCGYWNLDEPFKVLYTQGMVCNAAYKNKNDTWIESTDIIQKNGKFYIKNSDEEVQCIGSEKMSKSKKNGIEPREYIERFGADTIRMFVLSDSPPDKDLDWNDNAVEGVYKYLQKLYRLVSATNNGATNQYDNILQKLMHKTIHNVTKDYSEFNINKAIARVRELTNALTDAIACDIDYTQQKSVLCTIMQLLHPIIPHLTAEIWSILSNSHDMCWPIADDKYLIDDEITLAIQVNGKMRGTIIVTKDLAQNTIEETALRLIAVKQAISDNEIIKIIYVKNRIINFIC